MTFPLQCIRGIPNESFLLSGREVGSHLFYFQPEYKRTDRWVEQSINWKDDDAAINFTLEQTKDGEIQFKGGIAIISREQVDSLKNLSGIKDTLAYERDPLVDNRYHGNLLLKANTPALTMKKIAAAIALCVCEVIPPL